MSDGPLERGWLSDLIMHKLSKAKAHPWGLAVHGEVLPVVEWRDEWQTCGWEAWQQTLCSRTSPGTSCVLLGAGSAYSDWEKKILPPASVPLNQGPNQRCLWLSCFNNHQQRKEMHWGIYKLGPGLVVRCQDPRGHWRKTLTSGPTWILPPLFICLHLFLLQPLCQKVSLLQIHLGLRYAGFLALISSS